jgi:ATP synthase protein I
MSDADDDRKARQNSAWLEMVSIGWMFPVAIGVGFALGWWLDKTFHTRPWLTAIFTAFGIIAAFVNFFRTAMRGSGD